MSEPAYHSPLNDLMHEKISGNEDHNIPADDQTCGNENNEKVQ
jgi:hypothetical protein